MGSVQMTDLSCRFGKKGLHPPLVYPHREFPTHHRPSLGLLEPTKDCFELSNAAQESLAQLQQSFERVLQEHEDCASLFPHLYEETAAQKSDPLTTLAHLMRLRSIIQDPKFKERAEANANFTQFCEKIISLINMGQDTLSQASESQSPLQATTSYRGLRSVGRMGRSLLIQT